MVSCVTSATACGDADFAAPRSGPQDTWVCSRVWNVGGVPGLAFVEAELTENVPQCEGGDWRGSGRGVRLAVKKPAEGETLWRSRANLVRSVRFGPFELDVRSGELQYNGRKDLLHEQPFQVLLALLGRPRGVSQPRGTNPATLAGRNILSITNAV